jgi:serine/threonine protein kinase
VVKLLATFEKLSRDGTPTFFLLFDWAHGNLEDFWRVNQRLERDPRHIPLMAQQFLGIAEALHTVHNERQTNLKQPLPELGPSQNQSVYCRHGDITPQNLLWFKPVKSDGRVAEPLLVLADFGLGRLHSRVTRSKVNPRSTGFTATYRSPEFDLDSFISPASDVFSLGCVYLEHITWFLCGYGGIKHEFAERRLEEDVNGFSADTFFSITREGSPIIKPAVRAWIEELKEMPQCTQCLRQMLEIVVEMLEPDQKRRIRTWKLAKALKLVLRTCKENSSFYMK